MLRQTFLALALSDDSTTGAEAAELADRAFTIAQGDATLDPVAAIEAAKQQAPPLTGGAPFDPDEIERRRQAKLGQR